MMKDLSKYLQREMRDEKKLQGYLDSIGAIATNQSSTDTQLYGYFTRDMFKLWTGKL